MGQVWLQVTIHASCKRMNHEPAAHLSAAGLCPASIPCTGGAGSALSQRSEEAQEKRRVRNDIATEVCPLPVRCRAGDEQVSLAREDGEQWPGAGRWNSAGRNGRDKERLNFSVLESAAVKPRLWFCDLICHIACWRESGYHSRDILRLWKEVT